jgi:hypothetical protein
VPSDLIHAAQLQLIRPEEFRKNAVKFGWELWEPKQAEYRISVAEGVLLGERFVPWGELYASLG